MLKFKSLTIILVLAPFLWGASDVPLEWSRYNGDSEARLFSAIVESKGIYLTQTGHVEFISDAPLESISAISDKLRGAVDTSASTFAFSVDITSFKGFNSALQQEHFNENYLESERFPTASFTGRIMPHHTPGTYQVRAKGYLTIHGVKKERIIPCKVVVGTTGFRITSSFSVEAGDHGIKIPRIVYEKISPHIKVLVDCELKPAK
jgi:YceI-like domain